MRSEPFSYSISVRVHNSLANYTGSLCSIWPILCRKNHHHRFEQQRPSDEDLPRVGVPAPWPWVRSRPKGVQVNRWRFSSRCVCYGRQRSVRTVKVAATQTFGARSTRQQSSPSLHSYYSTSDFKSQTRSPGSRSCPTQRTCQERVLFSPALVHQRPIGPDRSGAQRLSLSTSH